jgi:hypothetical protein
VADHSEYRLQVREIVWDDALFERRYSIVEEFRPARYEPFKGPFWFQDPVSGRRPTTEENFALYNMLYLEQQQIIEAKLDIDTFRYGLIAFTSLKRVTITSEVHHQRVRTSLQEYRHFTPLTRSFPRGFEYPCPWPRPRGNPDENQSGWDMMWSDVKNRRGSASFLKNLPTVHGQSQNSLRVQKTGPWESDTNSCWDHP